MSIVHSEQPVEVYRYLNPYHYKNQYHISSQSDDGDYIKNKLEYISFNLNIDSDIYNNVAEDELLDKLNNLPCMPFKSIGIRKVRYTKISKLQPLDRQLEEE